MELDVNTSEANVVDGVETVEVIAGGEDAVDLGSSSAAATLIDQHIAAVATPQEILVPTSEVQIEGQALDQALLAHGTPIITIPVGPPSPGATQQMLVGTKRSQPEALTTESLMTVGTGTMDALPIPTSAAATQPSPDVPRKKSRNYLDSHKTIEKKRRDRINNCLEQLKNLVPDCRQYGSKKLDKAEILEMSIEYIQRIQNQGLGGKSTLGLDINMSQREWANDLTTWVIQNKILHTGPSALDNFCQSLLLHLQSMGSGNALASATSMLLNQASAAAAAASGNEDDALFRQQATANTQAALLQQIQQQQQSVAVTGATTKDAGAGGGGMVGVANGGGGGGVSAAAVGGAGSSTSAGSANQQTQTQQQLQQAQLTQLQALLLLQQQQQLLNQQQQQETDAQSQQTHLQQLQQLQQLQALLLQHIANEASANTSTTASGGSTAGVGTADSADSIGGGGSGGESQVPSSKSDSTQTTHTEATLQVDDASSVLTGSNPMTGEGAASAGLSGDHPAVELSQPSEEELAETTEETVYTSAISQMWSSAGSAQAGQGSSLLMLGGGSESEGEGVGGINGRSGGKSSLIETSEVQEEVELLSQQEH